MKKYPRSAIRVLIGVALAVSVSACSTVQSAYNTSVDTVSGWFKSEEKKDENKDVKK